MIEPATEQPRFWALPASVPELPADTVHVWLIDLVQSSAITDRLFATLAPDEQQRADRFFTEQHRQRWIVGRGALRAMLSAYIGMAPERVGLTYGPQGKPALDGVLRQPPLRFNLAHSHDMALVAVAHDREIGVDLEFVQPRARLLKIAERFFSARERAVLQSLPPQQQLAAFFRCWTRKEAYIKARGGGLSIPLRQFDVSFEAGTPAALLADRADQDEARRWTLSALSLPHGYAGALAVEGDGWRLQTWRWLPV